ncbi:WecB/TagA/CpsF family glycosyltransferase [Gordonia oleivorans]|uniref:WecB/TagA/CpsF family glycosyltransferase n=1 Tax=Gordonia oleivorans TaxID=3156618 RepID=UPI003CCD850F
MLDGREYSSVLDVHLKWLTTSKRRTSFALHVGGLNHRDNASFVQAFNSADYSYADGISVVALARISGIPCIDRSPTTDLGADLLRQGPIALGRPVRVAVVGGTNELVKQTSTSLEALFDAHVCFHRNGYKNFADEDFEQLRRSQPDVLFIGMGMPLEAMFCAQYIADLPECLVMTCGGWFGFLTGQEKRAPMYAQKFGVEWLFRLAQDPRRLFPRYLRGVHSFVQLSFVAAKVRIRTVSGEHR